MKRCPVCRRDYTDETLNYCLDDGTALLDGPGTADSLFAEPPTAILHDTASPLEAETRAQIHTTDQTGVPSFATDDGASRRHAFDKRHVAALVLLGVIAVAGFLAYRYVAPSGVKSIESIAVLPFVNESGNAEIEYLSDGMTETLINSLSQLPNLSVKARSSVFRYKGKEVDPKKIASELNVQTILTGRVVQRGDQLTLNLELIDAETESTLWGHKYERKASDLVSLQSEIARDVSSKLKSKLSGADVAKVEKNYTEDPEAYQLYLKGNYHRTKYSEGGYKKAIEYYQQALEIDPNYALAYVGIGLAYQTASSWYLPPNEAAPKVKNAAQKALDLDSSLGEAHALLGSYELWYGWDWAACEKEFVRAIELGSANAHRGYAYYLAATGRSEQAIQQAALAQSLAPLDLQINSNLAFIYLVGGRNTEALEQARRTIEMDQNYWSGYRNAGLAYARMGHFPEAVAELEKARSLDDNPEANAYLGYGYGVAGRTADAQKVLTELKEATKQRYVPAFSIAYVYAGLREKDKAFEWLDKAFEERGVLALMKVNPVFDNLREDPRFDELLKRMNLPE